jgi:dihydrofolate reductase
MKALRKIIVYIATSADGYIARPDGDVEWLNRRPRTADYGMREFYPTIDTILWGRKTYDWLLDYYKGKGKKSAMFDSRVANYVFSRRPPRRPAPGVEFVSESVKRFAQRLRATPGKQIWMMGGGGLIASFLDAGEIDEFDLHVIPVLIGKGIPLIAPRHRDIELRLIAAKKYADGVVRLRYEVPRSVREQLRARSRHDSLTGRNRQPPRWRRWKTGARGGARRWVSSALEGRRESTRQRAR